MQKHLRADDRLTRKFSEIAGTQVQVYFNNKTKRYELWYKGRQIVGLLDKGITASPHVVRDHFTKLRYGVQYKQYHRALLNDQFRQKDERDDAEVEQYWYDNRHEMEKASRNPITISG